MVTINLKDGKEYGILFDMNILEEIQERYGDISSLGEVLGKLKEVKWIVTATINEAIEFNNYEHGNTNKLITEKYVGMFFPVRDFNNGNVKEKIIQAFLECMGTEKNEQTE